jgi:hypothetical protein
MADTFATTGLWRDLFGFKVGWSDQGSKLIAPYFSFGIFTQLFCWMISIKGFQFGAKTNRQEVG